MRADPFSKLILSATIAFGLCATSSKSQTSPPPKRSATIAKQSSTMSVSLSISGTQILPGINPIVSLTIKNRSDADISFPDEQRVHVEGEKGEPQTKLRQRQLTHSLLPGEQELVGGGYQPTIARGESFTRRYDLGKLYDLTKPGKYSVFMEILDESASKDNAGVWVRSNVVTFEVVESRQDSLNP